MPVYKRQKITDELHELYGMRTDYQFLTKRKMKEIQKTEEFKNEAELDETIEARHPVAEIFQAGYIELCGVVYCLASRGLPVKFL